MASTIRKRLSKRHAVPDLKGISTDDEGNSTSSSGEDVRSKLTSTKKEPSIARNEFSDASSPPGRRLRSRSITSSARIAPSPPLLFKYTKRSAAKQAVSSSKPVEATGERGSHSELTFNKLVDIRPLDNSESMNEQITLHNETRKATKIVDGVEFEMVNRKQSCEAPTFRSHNAASVPQRRQTRSQTRIRERADSHCLDAELEEPHKVEGRIIRAVQDNDHTPSALVDTDDASLTTACLSTSTPTDNPQRHLPPSPQTLLRCSETIHPSPELPKPSALTQDIPKISSYRRHKQARSIAEDVPPMRVIPPIFKPNVPIGYLWVSSLRGSSRPSEPWGWLKKWTCCQCDETDPLERDQPTLTMVEQKVCARLECGHERCALGCRLLPDPRYNAPGVFG